MTIVQFVSFRKLKMLGGKKTQVYVGILSELRKETYY